MMTFKELKEKWDVMPIYANAFLLLDSTHPLEFNIGYGELNQKTLLIMNSGKLNRIPSSKSIAACNFQQSDGSWALSFRLVRIDNEDVFLWFCWDIVESSRSISDKSSEFIIGRYSKWLRLMERKPLDIMDSSRQRGLIGELLFLAELSDIYGKEKALQSWFGPEGADQDFIYNETWAEIKTLATTAENVSISSLEQLEVDQDGLLVIYILEKTTPSNHFGFSLADKVLDARKLMEKDLDNKEILEFKLFQYGYKDLDEYTIQKYRLLKKQVYIVNDLFPRLTSDNVSNAIVKVKYKISLAAINTFLYKEA